MPHCHYRIKCLPTQSSVQINRECLCYWCHGVFSRFLRQLKSTSNNGCFVMSQIASFPSLTSMKINKCFQLCPA
nr:hypothetical protein Iba_chr14aCG18290 [Ipomoea batatas]